MRTLIAVTAIFMLWASALQAQVTTHRLYQRYISGISGQAGIATEAILGKIIREAVADSLSIRIVGQTAAGAATTITMSKEIFVPSPVDRLVTCTEAMFDSGRVTYWNGDVYGAARNVEHAASGLSVLWSDYADVNFLGTVDCRYGCSDAIPSASATNAGKFYYIRDDFRGFFVSNRIGISTYVWEAGAPTSYGSLTTRYIGRFSTEAQARSHASQLYDLAYWGGDDSVPQIATTFTVPSSTEYSYVWEPLINVAGWALGGDPTLIPVEKVVAGTPTTGQIPTYDVTDSRLEWTDAPQPIPSGTANAQILEWDHTDREWQTNTFQVILGDLAWDYDSADEFITLAGDPLIMAVDIGQAALDGGVQAALDNISAGTGDDGWSPVFSVTSDGARRVLRLSSWVGGEGSQPSGVGQYVGATGLTTVLADAVDIRGAAGAAGATGAAGAAGATGAAGVAGADGATGPAGTAGAAGATGAAGAAGADGASSFSELTGTIADAQIPDNRITERMLDATLQNHVSASWQGTWSAVTNYPRGAVVAHSSAVWIAETNPLAGDEPRHIPNATWHQISNSVQYRGIAQSPGSWATGAISSDGTNWFLYTGTSTLAPPPSTGWVNISGGSGASGLTRAEIATDIETNASVIETALQSWLDGEITAGHVLSLLNSVIYTGWQDDIRTEAQLNTVIQTQVANEALAGNTDRWPEAKLSTDVLLPAEVHSGAGIRVDQRADGGIDVVNTETAGEAFALSAVTDQDINIQNTDRMLVADSGESLRNAFAPAVRIKNYATEVWAQPGSLNDIPADKLDLAPGQFPTPQANGQVLTATGITGQAWRTPASPAAAQAPWSSILTSRYDAQILTRTTAGSVFNFSQSVFGHSLDFGLNHPEGDVRLIRALQPGALLEVGGETFTISSTGVIQTGDLFDVAGSFGTNPTLVDEQNYDIRITQARPGEPGPTGSTGPAGSVTSVIGDGDGFVRTRIQAPTTLDACASGAWCQLPGSTVSRFDEYDWIEVFVRRSSDLWQGRIYTGMDSRTHIGLSVVSSAVSTAGGRPALVSFSGDYLGFTASSVPADNDIYFGSPTAVLTGASIEVWGLVEGSDVLANPTGTDGDDLTRIRISGTNYNLAAGGGGGGGGSETLYEDSADANIGGNVWRCVTMSRELTSADDGEREIEFEITFAPGGLTNTITTAMLLTAADLLSTDEATDGGTELVNAFYGSMGRYVNNRTSLSAFGGAVARQSGNSSGICMIVPTLVPRNRDVTAKGRLAGLWRWKCGLPRGCYHHGLQPGRRRSLWRPCLDVHRGRQLHRNLHPDFDVLAANQRATTYGGGFR